MLNALRYRWYGCVSRKLHCVQTPTTAIRTAWRGPRSSSDMTFAAYDTDNVEPLASGIGSFTFQAEVRTDRSSSIANSSGCGKVEGMERMKVIPPVIMMPATYMRALRGSADQVGLPVTVTD